MRIFTPRSARECAGTILPVARLMRRLFRDMVSTRDGAGNPEGPVNRAYFALVEGFLSAVGRIEAEGVRVQNPHAGFLDFPAIRDGRQVFLCWSVDEPSVAYWHEPGAGLAGRQPVDEDGPWEPPTAAARGAG